MAGRPRDRAKSPRESVALVALHRATKRYEGRLRGIRAFLGRWPTEGLARLACARAAAYLGLRLPKRAPRKVLPASPEELRREARQLYKRRDGRASKFIGVRKDGRKIYAEIRPRRKGAYLGTFRTEEEAACAYDRVARKVLGPKAILNFPGDPSSTDVGTLRREARASWKEGRSSGFLGVSLDPARDDRPWVASIAIDYRTLILGRYTTERDAAVAHDRAALHYFGSNAKLNFPARRRSLVAADRKTLMSEALREAKCHTKSRFLGLVQSRGKWHARITKQGHRQNLGTFDAEEDAARAYDRAVLRLRGRGAKFNFHPDTGEEIVGYLPSSTQGGRT